MIGCLLIHGFTGSPFEVEPLAEFLHKKGWNVSAPTLPGHGNSKEDMARVTWKDWVQKAEEEVRRMLKECTTVYLVGFSMGGMIASYLAAKYPVAKLVLLNTAVFYINPKQIYENMAEAIKSNFTADSKDLIRRYMQKSISTPIRAVVHFRRLIKVLKPEIDKVSTPTLIIQSQKDDLVEPRSADYLFEHIGSTVKEIRLFPKSKHIILHDCEQDQVIAVIDEFLCK